MQFAEVRRLSTSADVRVSRPEFAYILPPRRAVGAARRQQRRGDQRRRPALRARYSVVGLRPLRFRHSARSLPQPRSAVAQAISAHSTYILSTRTVGAQLPNLAVGHRRGLVRHRDPDFRLVASGVLPLGCLHLYVETHRSPGQHALERLPRRKHRRRSLRRRPSSHCQGGASWRG